jgi:glycosyltransferase involved in cell wall biosynthesis
MISILIPLYNGVEFLHESVISVLNQTYTKWELIIGINGHPPNSVVFQQAKRYEQMDERIRVIDMPHINNKSKALNQMVEHTNYTYIALLDVDDIWFPEKLEIQTKFIHMYDVVGSQCVYFGNLNNILPNIPIYDISKFDFSNQNPIINSSVIIKKELCHWQDKWNEDYDLWIRLRKKQCSFYNCPNILIKHRIHNNSAFNSKGNHTKVHNLLKEHFGI